MNLDDFNKMRANEFFGTKAAPIADYSWEVSALLSRTAETTDEIPAEFRQPVVILGLHAEVIAATSVGGLRVPDVKDIRAEVNSNGDTYYTSFRNGARSTAGPGANFVQLGSLLIPERLLFIDLEEAAPDLLFRFGWKLFDPATTPAAPIYEDALINVTMFCLFPDKRKPNASTRT